jgi:cell wall-associated NlpC family hydrolase
LTKLLISLALTSTLAVAGTTQILYASSPRASFPSSAQLVGPRIASVALSYVGYRYAYVGDTPATGFSCIGFVHWVYSQFGYDTPEDLGVLYYRYPHIAPAAMQPGDVLLFANTFHAGLSHVAIYIGGGQMVGADNFSVGVHVDAVYDGYFGPRFVGAIRIAPNAAPRRHVAGSAYGRTATTFHRSSPRRAERRPFWHALPRY